MSPGRLARLCRENSSVFSRVCRKDKAEGSPHTHLWFSSLSAGVSLDLLIRTNEVSAGKNPFKTSENLSTLKWKC